ncbi:NADPH-dependent FMN reductase [Microbacterium aurum]
MTVVVGNPKPASRTLDAGTLVARGLRPDVEPTVLDLVEFGPALLNWGNERVGAAVRTVRESELVVFASPTFKATYTGLLKLFLEQFEGGTGLAGVVAAPVMLGAGPAHALAPDLLLKPVLVEVGATAALPVSTSPIAPSPRTARSTLTRNDGGRSPGAGRGQGGGTCMISSKPPATERVCGARSRTSRAASWPWRPKWTAPLTVSR